MIIRRENQRGFTLIEILMVTAIIGILTAIAVARFADYHDRARQGSVLHDLRVCLIETAIEIQEDILPSNCFISEHESYDNNPFIDEDNMLSKNLDFKAAGYGFVFDGRRLFLKE